MRGSRGHSSLNVGVAHGSMADDLRHSTAIVTVVNANGSSYSFSHVETGRDISSDHSFFASSLSCDVLTCHHSIIMMLVEGSPTA